MNENINFINNSVSNNILNNNNIIYKYSLNMITFNTNGAKRNLNFIKDLLIYDIIYICETWLMDLNVHHY